MIVQFLLTITAERIAIALGTNREMRAIAYHRGWPSGQPKLPFQVSRSGSSKNGRSEWPSSRLLLSALFGCTGRPHKSTKVG